MDVMEATPKMVEDQMDFTEGTLGHALGRPFTMWYLRGDRNREWLDCLKQLVAFKTVEGFWAIYNHILPPSRLEFGSDYYVFRQGIKPMWEDDNNARGGRWIINVDRLKRNTRLDAYWMELLVAMIGEQFEDNQYICGVVVNCRHKGDKISVWTRDAEQDEINLRIGKQLKTMMDIPDSEQLLYVAHKVAAVRSGSVVKPRLSIPRQRTCESPVQD
uniref:eIF-4F 25 kDa subunit n=1 Tax=Steinernema glaseri TaxID=37863 RepID=A0A1I7YB70_9BILA